MHRTNLSILAGSMLALTDFSGMPSHLDLAEEGQNARVNRHVLPSPKRGRKAFRTRQKTNKNRRPSMRRV